MTTEEIRNEQPYEEAATTTQSQKGESMGEQPKQDQQGAGQNSEKKTRKPYDGSKAHGVVVENINDVKQATKAKARLRLRLEYLNNEFAKCVSIIQDPEKSVSEKAPAITASEKINEDLKKLQVVAKELKEKVPELEKKIENKILNFNPATKVDVTI